MTVQQLLNKLNTLSEEQKHLPIMFENSRSDFENVEYIGNSSYNNEDVVLIKETNL